MDRGGDKAIFTHTVKNYTISPPESWKMNLPRLVSFILLLSLISCAPTEPTQPDFLWHKKTLTFEGPPCKENPSTFLDFRLQVQFEHVASGKAYEVPGFFAADGNAAETSADSGAVWKVHFVPDEIGLWKYHVKFRKGKSIAVSLDPKAGETAGYMDEESGEFTVEKSTQLFAAQDFRNGGMLNYAGQRYLQHAGTGKWFLKGGAGSPENFLAYEDFDGTYDNGGTHYPALGENQIHGFTPHQQDWREGDPLWQHGKGTEIIGAINYISQKGLNAAYLVTMNVEGDGNDLWPWTGPQDREVFDVSKLAQWEIVFDHMDHQGIFKDFLLTETENESLFEALDGGGNFAHTRKLYYREMIARFGHCLGVSWNLGEENGHDGTGEEPYKTPITSSQMLQFGQYLKAVDPYDHHVVVHNWPGDEWKVFGPLLATDAFDGVSLQEDGDYYGTVLDWVNKADSAGKAWIVSVDEPLGWEYGLQPDADDPDHDKARTTVLWPTLLAGGAGIDWYFGWQNNAPTSDLSNEDWRSRENMWEQTKIALDFFHQHLPFQEMKSMPEFRDSARTFVFAKPGEIYVLYSLAPDDLTIELGSDGSNYQIHWFDPIQGGDLQSGSITTVTAIGSVSLGTPPAGEQADWVCLLRRVD